MNMSASYPKPAIDEDNKPFWDAVRNRKFVLMRCLECGAWYWPAAYCRNHANQPFYGSLEWREASGRGKVFAYNVHHRAFDPAFKTDLPYVYALIELEEGPMFGTNIVDCEPGDVSIGMDVEVRFIERGGALLPVFGPRGLSA